MWECPDGSDLTCPPFGLNEFQNGVYFKDSERELLMCIAIIDTMRRGLLVYDITNKKWAQGPHIPSLMRGQVNDVAHLVSSLNPTDVCMYLACRNTTGTCTS